MIWVKYTASGILIILGLFSLQFALRKRTAKEKMLKKELPLTGPDGKAHFIYLGLFCLILAAIILFKA
jgi:LPXTG-motif cell wall-anchored protein